MVLGIHTLWLVPVSTLILRPMSTQCLSSADLIFFCVYLLVIWLWFSLASLVFVVLCPRP